MTTAPPDLALLHAANGARRAGRPDAALEHEAERRYGASRRLAAYGSLVPGRENHPLVADLRGTWRGAIVHGDLRQAGWGATRGFPALRWRADGPPVPAMVLESDDLPHAWPRIDAFEGDEYRRVLIPVELTGELVLVASLYEDATDG